MTRTKPGGVALVVGEEALVVTRSDGKAVRKEMCVLFPPRSLRFGHDANPGIALSHERD